MIVIIINFIFCPNIIYFCNVILDFSISYKESRVTSSVLLDFSISYKESGFKIITINWHIAISWILLNCNIMLNYNKISGIYILTNPVIYKWPNRFVYKKNRYFYVKLLLSRTLDFFNAFCGTDITIGAQYATLTLSSCPGASIE
jgi:hypothetical protein